MAFLLKHPVESYDGKDSGPQPALEALARMREQEQLPPGPLPVDAVLQALERLERPVDQPITAAPGTAADDSSPGKRTSDFIG